MFELEDLQFVIESTTKPFRDGFEMGVQPSDLGKSMQLGVAYTVDEPPSGTVSIRIVRASTDALVVASAVKSVDATGRVTVSFRPPAYGVYQMQLLHNGDAVAINNFTVTDKTQRK